VFLLNRFHKIKQLKKSLIDVTKGIDDCPICREKRREIVEHAKAGHPNEN
jgi:hypothetical protein